MGNSRWDRDVAQLQIKNPKKVAALAALAVMVILALAFARQSFYTVSPEEQGVVLRFGKFVRTAEPGLHGKIPFGVERVYKVPVQRQLKQEFGFRTVQADVKSQYRKKGYEDESLMLTGDLNSADVEWIVQYRIADPLKYLFNVRDVEKTFHDISEATMREIVGDRSVDEVITWGKEEINIKVKEKLQQRADQYETGLSVRVVLLQDVNAPPPVQPSWNKVNEAEQEKDKLINQAKSKYNTVVPKARGEAERQIKEAEGYAIERVNLALGQAHKFEAVYAEYKKAPQVTRKRYYLETMADILPKAGRKVIVDKEDTGVLRLLDLDGKGGGK